MKKLIPHFSQNSAPKISGSLDATHSLNLLYTNLKINLVTILTCDRLTSPVFTSLDWTVILCGLNVEGRLLERLLSKKSRKKSHVFCHA